MKTNKQKIKVLNYVKPTNKFNKFVLLTLFFMLIASALIYAERLPTLSSDQNIWGTILNNYLLKEHSQNGTHVDVTINSSLRIYNNSDLSYAILNINATSKTFQWFNGNVITENYSLYTRTNFTNDYNNFGGYNYINLTNDLQRNGNINSSNTSWFNTLFLNIYNTNGYQKTNITIDYPNIDLNVNDDYNKANFTFQITGSSLNISNLNITGES